MNELISIEAEIFLENIKKIIDEETYRNLPQIPPELLTGSLYCGCKIIRHEDYIQKRRQMSELKRKILGPI
jgi:hypothetical protein